MFGDLVNFLLKLVFALQEEEDEEEEKLAQVCGNRCTFLSEGREVMAV